MREKMANQIFYYTSACAFLVSAIATWLPSGYVVGFTLLFLASLPLVLVPRWRPLLTKNDQALLGVILLFAGVWLAEVLLWGQPTRLYEKPARFLAAAAILLLLRKYPPKPASLWAGLIVGAWGSLALMGWERIVLDLDRREGLMNAIQFGGLAILMACLCLAGLGWAALQTRKRLWSLLLLSGFAAGLLAALWSGSRGAWLGLPVALAMLYVVYRPWLNTRLVLSGTALLGVMLALVIAMPQTSVQQRLAKAIEDVRLYAQDTTIRTSNGGRFEMWKASLRIGLEHPIFGVGETGYVEHVREQAKTGQVAAYVVRFRHAHNEFLDVFAKRGLVGVVSLLLLYGVPLRLFMRNGSALKLEQRAYAGGGMVLVGLYATFGLTQTFLSGHNNGLMMFLAYLLLFHVAFQQAGRPVNEKLNYAQ